MCLAVPGELLSIEGGNIEGNDPMTRTGKVSFGGAVKTVSLAFVPDVDIGDFVIVHVGFAISILDRAAALQTLQDLDDIEASVP
ncbi:MAG: HypC/HybG/HupF family hydrogenase formation chaperone [Cyanobacteria bacterium J06648_11]